ncbi:DUF523 and DUF1722 domain-containing protein [Aliiglaciecola sp. CAU 1673]|uniref:YbgA family protein n=1 Tax=Aliiglaciecola sp. CAU 1673 TaxID=3032595 RepID=UPI0023DAE4BC|nr:DUF523 and DUF1722 domain-containing protein [Aliiglaciecola sp. CAU 1673]MDF2177591.1 DUF523 and DUF1722 domain-containing protein [Aliiglaciecola sp. CAU 1673]
MPKIGISACVMGSKVRYDGGHKRSSFVMDKLGSYVSFVPLCPEVGMGMSVPRPTIHLRETAHGIRLTDSKDGSIDHTDKMQRFFSQHLEQLAPLDGYILAAKSPSCGMERIKVYSEEGELQRKDGQGLFVQLLKQHFPHLPMEEDGRLNDAGLRESFVTRIFAYQAFREQVASNPSVSSLVAFHSRYKLLIMSYSPVVYRQLGRLVANAKVHLESAIEQYLGLMMQALSKVPNRKKQTNVLMHIQGYFKSHLNKADKHELCEQIEAFRLGHLPLMAPLTLLKHYLRRYPNDYLQQQAFFDPYPSTLGLRG